MSKNSAEPLVTLVFFGLVYGLLSFSVISTIGIFWISAIAFLISVLLDTRRAIDRLLLLTAVTLGVTPLCGWFELPSWLNPLEVIVAIYVADALRNTRATVSDSLGNVLSTTPAFVVGTFTYQWWSGLSKGTPVSVLERILPIWDLSAHFNFFYSNLVTGLYLPRTSLGELSTNWFGQDYPSGMHYVFGLFAFKQKEKVTLNPELALPIFANSVVVLLSFCVFIVAISGWRIADRSTGKFASSALVAGLSCALISVGPLSQTISTGFANMPAVIIPLVILLSIHLRPLDALSHQILVITSCVGAIAYNWYPALVLVLPIVITQAFKCMTQTKKIYVLGMFAGIVVLIVPPIVQTFSLGVSQLDMAGGIQPFPAGILAVLLFASFATAIISLALKSNGLKYFSANIVPLPFAVAFATWLHIRSQGYNYYFHKFMLFVAVFSAIAILFSILHFSSQHSLNLAHQGIRRSAAIVLGSTVVSFGISQSLGYWGPDYPSFSGASTAFGVLNRNEITMRSQTHLENAEQILRLVNVTKGLDPRKKECILLFVPLNSKILLNNNYGPSISLLTNVWYHSLSRSNTEKSQVISSAVVNLTSFVDSSQIAASIVNTYNPKSVCIYTTEKVAKSLSETKINWSLETL